MELEGMERCLARLDSVKPDNAIQLTTDGHKSVEKWLKDNKSENVKHYFDVWHVAKGLLFHSNIHYFTYFRISPWGAFHLLLSKGVIYSMCCENFK